MATSTHTAVEHAQEIALSSKALPAFLQGAGRQEIPHTEDSDQGGCANAPSEGLCAMSSAARGVKQPMRAMHQEPAGGYETERAESERRHFAEQYVQVNRWTQQKLNSVVKVIEIVFSRDVRAAYAQYQ